MRWLSLHHHPQLTKRAASRLLHSNGWVRRAAPAVGVCWAWLDAAGWGNGVGAGTPVGGWWVVWVDWVRGTAATMPTG